MRRTTKGELTKMGFLTQGVLHTRLKEGAGHPHTNYIRLHLNSISLCEGEGEGNGMERKVKILIIDKLAKYE